MAGLPSHKGTGAKGRRAASQMPTLFRLLVIIGIHRGDRLWRHVRAGDLVEPKKGEMTVRIPLEKLNKQQ